MSDTIVCPECCDQNIECPLCGDTGAESDAEGLFVDGQPLICGCPGRVCVDDYEGGADIWINNDTAADV